MRILSIGYPLPNMAIDNYNPLTAPSYCDYDALIIDPGQHHQGGQGPRRGGHRVRSVRWPSGDQRADDCLCSERQRPVPAPNR